MSNSIPQRPLGSSLVPAIGFGVMGISGGYGAIENDEERLKVLDAAYASGCTFWDTANIYGDSEELIGKWLAKNPEKRPHIFLATKFGIQFDGPVRGDPEYVRECFEKSLKRLGVDYVDLYYQHRVDPKTPIEITIGAMADLVKAGKVKHLGLSDCTAKGLERAHSVHPITALQVEYSPLFRPPQDLLTKAKALGVKIVAYSPLGRGVLTGQIKSVDDFEEGDFRRFIPKFSNENFPKILALVNKIGEVGKKHNATPGQTTLAWILSQGEEFFAIPGTKKVKYMKENVGAGSVKLTPEEVAEITKAADEAGAGIPGDMYGEGWIDLVYVESPSL